MESHRNINGLTERYVVTLEHRDADYWTPHETAAHLSARRDHDSQHHRSGEWRLFWSRRKILSTGVTLPNTSDVEPFRRAGTARIHNMNISSCINCHFWKHTTRTYDNTELTPDWCFVASSQWTNISTVNQLGRSLVQKISKKEPLFFTLDLLSHLLFTVFSLLTVTVHYNTQTFETLAFLQ